MKKIYSTIITSATILIVVIFINNSTKAQSGLNATFNSTPNSYIDFGRGQNLGCITDLQNGNKLTITMWVKWGSKLAAGVSSWANMFTLADSSGNGDNGVFWLQYNSTNTLFEFALQTQSGRSYIYSSTNPTEGVWYHIACVYDGSLPINNMKIYVNGVQENSTNKTGNLATFSNVSKLNMGRWANPNGNYRRFNGNIDEVSIWKRALTAAEISTIKTNPINVVGGLYDAVGLIGYWNFDDNTANDLCSCHNNGIMGTAVVLPIELTKFNAESKGNIVEVNWTTASEINNDYFSVERSTNGKEFEKIGKINGSGNSNTTLSYNYIDNEPKSGISYYRLRQTDFDGATTISNIVAVNTNLNNNNSLTIFPNPSNGENINFRMVNSNSEISKIQIFDYSGRKVFESEFIDNFSLSNNLLSPGLYTVIANESGNLSTEILSIIRK